MFLNTFVITKKICLQVKKHFKIPCCTNNTDSSSDLVNGQKAALQVCPFNGRQTTAVYFSLTPL